MRRKTIFSAIVSAMLISQCFACASKKDAFTDFHTASLASIEPAEAPMRPENVKSAIAYTTLTSPVSLIFCTEEQSMTIENSTIYTNRCVYPIVTIEGNESASAKINADIQERVNAYQADAATFSLAEYDHQRYDKAEDSSAPCFSYYDELIFTAARADSRVISFLVMDQYYGGGAHGMDCYTGFNYDTETGERISFSKLSGNTDSFRQNTLAYHQALASTASYQGIMYDDATAKLEQVLYQDEQWYLSMSGLVFFSNPYELGAFYAGEIEFTIPYDELAQMGLQEKYLYEGTPLIHLQSEEPCYYDINGDGAEEEIRFYIDNMGSANTGLHFFIDGTDFAAEHKELSEQFSDSRYIFCWTKCFLYDIDEQDDMTEIVFQMNYSDWEKDIHVPYSFFYRYDKNGALAYLGKLEATVNDPTALFHFVP